MFGCQTWSTIHFPPVSPFKTSFFPQIESKKAIYRMVWMRFWMMHYLSELFFRQHYINHQPWLKLFYCQTRSIMYFHPVFAFKTSILPQMECEKAIYRMVCMRFWMMRYLSEMFFRQSSINHQPWLRLYCCHTWSTMHFPHIPPFKTSILPHIECEKAIYRMVWMRFLMMCYLLHIFFR